MNPRFFFLGLLLPCFIGSAAQAELAGIEGRVTSSESGEPLPYANIQVLGTGHGAIASEDGSFRLVGLSPGPARVQVTFIGYAPRTEEVNLLAARTVRVDIALAVEPIPLEPIRVTATRLELGQRKVILDKSYPAQVFTTDGYSLIRKGSVFASDLYSDGFKRGDIAVTIDGERFPNACPNRMDPATTRVNPMQVDAIEFDKSSASNACGLGGGVSFQREAPSADRGGQATVSAHGGHSDNQEVAFALDRLGFRGTGRYSRGGPYEDAEGRDFTELYGYETLPRHTLIEASVHGGHRGWQPVLGISLTEDVLFPYLQMDERRNDLWNAGVATGGHRLYVNHTDHVMDNTFRTGPMFMETVATNLTLGATGAGYEIYYRNWDADNQFVMPRSRIENHFIPDVHVGFGSLNHSWMLGSSWELAGLLGLEQQWVGDTARLDFHRQYHTGVEDSRLFVPFGLELAYTKAMRPWLSGGLAFEVASRAPEPEQLYIAVQKPMNKPDWSGNPGLEAPRRATLRARLRSRAASLELFGTRIRDYVALANRSDGTDSWMTYENVDAWVLGANLSGDWRYFEMNAAWNWGENSTHETALAEIQPLLGSATVKWPVQRLTPYVRYAAAARQDRVDPNLNEEPTAAWHRVDLGIRYSGRHFHAVGELENATNELYTQHLSYQRDPFASGQRVWEPGRSLRVSLGAVY